MKNRKILLLALLSTALVFSLILPSSAAGASAAVPRPDDRSISHMVADSSSAASAMALNTPEGKVTPMVAAGGTHTVGLKSDGTAVAVGFNYWSQCDVTDWTGITQVAAGEDHTVGLKKNGTVVAVGNNWYSKCDVGNWTDIAKVAAGYWHTVGLKSDGTVVAVGSNYYGQCKVSGWTGITQVAAGSGHTVGVKSDGTVVAVGDNDYGQCDVGGWTDIVQVAAGKFHTVGLKSDGTVVAVGSNDYGQCDVGGWNLGVIQYSLTISSTAGGSVTTPGEETFTYNAGMVVNLVAEPEEGYRLVRWTGDVRTISNINAASTTITMWGNYSITANFAIPPVQYNLTISSAAWGSVTSPGKGTFSYDEGTVVNLVAEADKGCGFIGWTGDVDTIADVTAASTNITMNGDYSITANFGNVKAGDWIKIKYTTIGWPEPYPEWLKVEFLSVAGTNANVRVTLHISDGSEQIDTLPVDLAEGGGGAFGLSGFVIPPNLTTGNSVYMSGFGNVTIAGEATIYAGARRTVVYTYISQYGLTYYWDKLTGVMAEAFGGSSGMTLKATVTETNMWEVVPSNVGIKAGDWIKMKYKTSGGAADPPYLEWLKLEFLSVEGTNATTQATRHWSDGTEHSDTTPVDVVEGGTVLGYFSGVVISANLTTGDSVYMTGLRFDGHVIGHDYGEVAIKGETTRTYAGATRTVVYASIGNIIEAGGKKFGTQETYYWDRLTGVIVERSTTSASWTATTTTTTYKVIETNMWEATTVGMPWWVWVIVAVAIGAVAFAVYRLKKRKTPTTPTPPTEGT